jgi:uncharacterized membrane protein
MQFGMTVGAFDVDIKIVFYYFYEWVWYPLQFDVLHVKGIEQKKRILTQDELRNRQLKK